MLPRRDFLKTAVGLAAGLLVPFRLPARPAFEHPELGRYVSHTVERNEHWENPYGLLPGIYPGMSWPVEVLLTIRFEKITITWVNFNATRDLCDRLRRGDPDRWLWQQISREQPFLRGHIDPNDDLKELTLIFPDEVSAVGEVDPTLAKIIPGKQSKFLPSLICLND